MPDRDGVHVKLDSSLARARLLVEHARATTTSTAVVGLANGKRRGLVMSFVARVTLAPMPSAVGWQAAIEDEESGPAARVSAFLSKESHITHAGHDGLRHAASKDARLPPLCSHRRLLCSLYNRCQGGEYSGRRTDTSNLRIR